MTTDIIEPDILRAVREAGHVVFTDGGYNLNIIGVRKNCMYGNVFDDLLYVVYKTFDVWIEDIYPITTDPGLFYIQNPLQVTGTAVVAPGQYRGVFEIGYHKGSYKALVQKKPITVYRERTVTLEGNEPKETGMFGINIHRASSIKASTVVDKWSAGCQVFADPVQFADFMSTCSYAAKFWGNSFTYTLLAG